jgi:hypothetical protein
MKKPAPDEAIRAYLRALGARGGKRGGKARWKGTTAEERSAYMRSIRKLVGKNTNAPARARASSSRKK